MDVTGQKQHWRAYSITLSAIAYDRLPEPGRSPIRVKI